MGHFAKAGITKGGKVGKRVVREWRVSEDAVLPVGEWCNADERSCMCKGDLI